MLRVWGSPLLMSMHGVVYEDSIGQALLAAVSLSMLVWHCFFTRATVNPETDFQNSGHPNPQTLKLVVSRNVYAMSSEWWPNLQEVVGG